MTPAGRRAAAAAGCPHPAHRSPRQQEQSPPGGVIPCPNPTHIHQPLSSLPAPLQAAIAMLSWDREVLPAPLNPAEARGAPNLSLLYRGFTPFGAVQPHVFFPTRRQDFSECPRASSSLPAAQGPAVSCAFQALSSFPSSLASWHHPHCTARPSPPTRTFLPLAARPADR